MGQEQFGRGNVWASAKEAGIFKDIPFKASNFTGSGGGSWTISTANIFTNRMERTGNKVTWSFWIGGSTLVGLNNSLFIESPVGDKISRYSTVMGQCLNAGAAGVVAVQANLDEGPGWPANIGISLIPLGNFTAGDFGLKFVLIFEYGNRFPPL